MKETPVTRWPEKSPPTENELRRLLADENLDPYRWSNGPDDIYTAHSHGIIR